MLRLIISNLPLTIAVLTLIAGPTWTQTIVQPGNVSGTWLTSGSPYLVTGEITVAAGDSLTIAPGCSVIFQGHYPLWVNGWFLALGEAGDSIIFTAPDTSIGWFGIRFMSAPDTSRLEYCIVEQGRARGNQPDSSFGGGIYCSNSNLVLVHSSIRNNQAQSEDSLASGGGIYADENSTLRLDNCNIANNSAASLTWSSFGGGIQCYSTANLIQNSIIQGNTAYLGGGICGSATIINCQIINNSGHHGGGIQCENSYVSGCIISYNHWGGGIACINSSSVVTACTISNNYGWWGGGVHKCSLTGVTISNCLITENIASEIGGGLYCASATTVDNCLIIDNSADEGGGVYCGFGANLDTIRIVSTTICSNESTFPEYGIHCSGSNLALSNCIIRDNGVGQIYYMPGSGSVTTAYCDIEGGWIGTGNIDENPWFVTGPQGDYCLSQFAAGQSHQSSCVDGGNPAAPLIPGTTRTDGVPDFGVVDMGYHYPSPAGSQPFVSIELTPYNPPIVIPHNGGAFAYDVEISNNSDTVQNFDAWINIKIPTGTEFVVLGPYSLTFPVGFSLIRMRAQAVPSLAPPGSYYCIGYIGNYPWIIADTDSFPFTKVGGNAAWLGTEGWFNSGDPFPAEMLTAQEPSSPALLPGNPNPFNATTSLRFTLPKPSLVTLEIYNTAGQRITTLIEGYRDAGYHEITWSAEHLPSGLYFCRLQAGDYRSVQKMVLLK